MEAENKGYASTIQADDFHRTLESVQHFYHPVSQC